MKVLHSSEKKNYFGFDNEGQEAKIEAFKNQTGNDTAMKLHNENYEETLNVRGLYNRMFLFDSIMFHGAHDFFGDDKESSRLTLILFFQKLSVGGNVFPISRMNMNALPTIL